MKTKKFAFLPLRTSFPTIGLNLFRLCAVVFYIRIVNKTT